MAALITNVLADLLRNAVSHCAKATFVTATWTHACGDGRKLETERAVASRCQVKAIGGLVAPTHKHDALSIMEASMTNRVLSIEARFFWNIGKARERTTVELRRPAVEDRMGALLCGVDKRRSCGRDASEPINH